MSRGLSLTRREGEGVYIGDALRIVVRKILVNAIELEVHYLYRDDNDPDFPRVRTYDLAAKHKHGLTPMCTIEVEYTTPSECRIRFYADRSVKIWRDEVARDRRARRAPSTGSSAFASSRVSGPDVDPAS